MIDKALSDVRVLDLSRLLPGPLCTLVLADLGADVVKVEDPAAGDYLRMVPPQVPAGSGHVGARFAALNRGKRSIALDLKQAAAREVFLRLVARAHVVVESFRPGVMARLGLDFASLRARNRNIVLCSITGYGQEGPWRERAGHDVNYIATAGVLAESGHAQGPPELPGVQIADCAGALWGVIGILAALRGGAAAHVDVSMTDAAMSFLIPLLGEALAGNTPPRGSDTLTGGLAGYNVYQTSDGHVALGALEPKFWQAFVQAIGLDAGSDADFDAQTVIAPTVDANLQAQLRDRVATIMGTRSTADWVKVLANKDVCCEPILQPTDLAEHPYHRARKNIFESFGVRYARTPLGAAGASRPAPHLGQHQSEVLLEYGLSEKDLERLT